MLVAKSWMDVVRHLMNQAGYSYLIQTSGTDKQVILPASTDVTDRLLSD